MSLSPVCTNVPICDPVLNDTNVGLGVQWNNGNSLAVFPKTWTKEQQQRMGGSKTCINIHQVAWSTSLYSPVFRKLINESAQVFFQIQNMAKDEEVIGNAHLVRMSRHYRSIIRDCQEQFDVETEIAANIGDEEKARGCAQQSELLYKLELIWNLVEIICIEKNTIGIVLPQLLQWISLHFPGPDEKAREILSQDMDRPESDPEFWDCMALFLLQGRTDQAQKLLRLHSGYSPEGAFVSLEELIRKMPIYGGNMSSVDFEFRWKHWRREVIARIDEAEFGGDENLANIANILAGSDDVFNRDLVNKCETWYQWMVGKLLYTCPDVKSYDLSVHAEQAINRFGGLSRMTSLDSVLLATMEQDMAQVLHELCTILDNFWFPCHLLDLLQHSDQLDHIGHHQKHQQKNDGQDTLQPGPGLREFLLLDYASCLLSHGSLWQLGVLYLDHCPTQGPHRLELLLERVPLETERKANRVISLAVERGLTGVVTQTCKVMGMRSLRDGRVGAAMTWALKSQDVKFTTFLADRLLKEYTESSNFSNTDLLDHLGTSMVLSDRLTFLAKYREFHKLVEQKEFRAAANLLHSLMWSRLAPKYFWVTLLIDAMPFISSAVLEDDYGMAMLNSEQTYELMHCLQELVKDTTLPKKERLRLQECEPQIRIELSRNLAVALMEEGES